MTATFQAPPCAEHKFIAGRTLFAFSAAETPTLNIRTKNGLPMEQQRKEQMLRPGKEYDLKRSENPRLLEDLPHTFPGLEYHLSEGDGQRKSRYFPSAVCMLEWQAMEELLAPESARQVMESRQQDHYKSIYAVLLEHGEPVERVLNRNGVRW